MRMIAASFVLALTSNPEGKSVPARGRIGVLEGAVAMRISLRLPLKMLPANGEQMGPCGLVVGATCWSGAG